jgi:hypothetical protein
MLGDKQVALDCDGGGGISGGGGVGEYGWLCCARFPCSLQCLLRKQSDTASVFNSANAVLQDMVEGVSDVRVMHDDISVGMKELKSFVSDRMTQVLLLLLVSLLDALCKYVVAGSVARLKFLSWSLS